MSNPGDCEVCGLDRHVLGCRPGKCKNEEAPPLGYAKCPKPGCPRWMGPGRVWKGQPDKGSCWTCLNLGFTDDQVLEPDWTPPTAPAPEHPLPWRWREWKDSMCSLVDANGIVIMQVCSMPAAPYVRAVTERAGAMEDGLRHLVNHIDHLRRMVAPGFLSLGLMVEHEAMRNLLAEIDTAKGGG